MKVLQIAASLQVLVVSCVAVVNVSRDLKEAYFINLDRMPSRRIHMENQLKSVGLVAQRWSAVDWRRVAKGEFDSEFVRPQGIVPALLEKPLKEGNGTIGCFLSHVTALMHASKEAQPNDVVLVMEDDVSLPSNWNKKLQRVLDMAPDDWELIKLSGWGSGRKTDLVKTIATDNESSNQTSSNVTTTPSPSSLVGKIEHEVGSLFYEEGQKYEFYHMSEPFTEPATWNWGTLGWGSPNFYYAGTGAYIVRGSALNRVVHHLRTRPINDIDAMLLSNDGEMRFYESWPHIFGLSTDAFLGPGLHGNKDFDEFDKKSKNDPDLSEPPMPIREGKTASRNGSDDKVQLAVMGRGMAVSQRKHKQARNADLVEEANEAAVATADSQSEARGSVIRRHNHAVSPKEVVEILQEGPKVIPAEETAGGLVYGHPAWLQDCSSIYLDVGSNIGVQVRKLFEPQRYEGAPALAVFDRVYGAADKRTEPSKVSGLCALGFEPNPHHRAHLQKLQDNYTARGWSVHFYPYAAWKSEGKMTFDMATQPSTESWGAKLTAGDKKDSKKTKDMVAVRTISLADFIRSLPPHSVKLMKMDIEGAEYETVTYMLKTKALCRGTVDAAFFESHPWGDITDWKDDRSFAAIKKHIAAADCGASRPTSVEELDDETYLRDDPEAEWKLRWQQKIKYAGYAGVAFSATLAMYLGSRRFSATK